MGWYRKSLRFIFDGFRRYNSKTTTIARIQNSVFLNTYFLTSSSSSSNATEFCKPFWRNSVLQNVLKNNQRCKSPFLDGAKRFYHVDTNQVHHFKPRGFRNWTQNPRNLFKLGSLGLLGFGVVTTVYLLNLETVPYTNRSHFVLFSTSLEKKLTESWLFEEYRKEYEGRIVPSHHPESIRVQRILKNIVESAPKGLRKKVVDDDDEEERGMSNWFTKPSANLEEFKWEIILVNEPTINAFCATGGKIFIFTGLLNFFEKDAEIAAVIGHEVGHALARHIAEMVSLDPWMSILMLIYDKISKDLRLMTMAESILDQLYQYFFPDNHAIYILSNLFLWLPFSRRMEKEADYIGLILMAAAGYDPHVAVEVWEKFEREGGLPLEDYYSTHPSNKTRAQLLSHPKVMEEAISLYNTQV